PGAARRVDRGRPRRCRRPGPGSCVPRPAPSQQGAGGGVNGFPTWYDPDDDRTARAAWSRLTEPVDAAAGAFVRRVGAAEALGHVLRGGGAGLAVAARWRSRL